VALVLIVPQIKFSLYKAAQESNVGEKRLQYSSLQWWNLEELQRWGTGHAKGMYRVCTSYICLQRQN